MALTESLDDIPSFLPSASCPIFSPPKESQTFFTVASVQTQICLLIILSHLDSKPLDSRRLILRKADFLEECRLSSTILPTTQVCASSDQQDFYFHSFVISSRQDYKWERWRRGRKRWCIGRSSKITYFLFCSFHHQQWLLSSRKLPQFWEETFPVPADLYMATR